MVRKEYCPVLSASLTVLFFSCSAFYLFTNNILFDETYNSWVERCKEIETECNVTHIVRPKYEDIHLQNTNEDIWIVYPLCDEEKKYEITHSMGFKIPIDIDQSHKMYIFKEGIYKCYFDGINVSQECRGLPNGSYRHKYEIFAFVATVLSLIISLSLFIFFFDIRK